MAETAVRVVIRGRVQGVWYRAWTEKQASELGLDGWVRNSPDGSVEALFAGPEPVVRDMIGRCWKGPLAAKVSDIEEHAADHPDRQGFGVRY